MMAQRGFTLLEMMVTISVLVILASIASPNMAPFIAKQRMKALAQDITDSIQLARSEALANGNLYQLIPTNEKSWSQGWRIELMDSNGKNSVFKRYDSVPSNILINSTTRTNDKKIITFDQNARINTMVNFEITHNSLNIPPYCIAVAASGNVQIQQAACDGF